MESEGIKLPEFFPIVEVLAETAKEAAKKILLVSSRFGKFTQSGLIAFVRKFGLKEVDFDFVELDTPDIIIDDFVFNNNENEYNALDKEDFFEEEEEEEEDTNDNKEIDQKELLSKLNATCPRCKFEFEIKK